MRVLRSALAFGFFIFGLAVVGAALAFYLAATGQSLPLLRAVAARVGQLTSGQQTEQLVLRVRIQPRRRELSGTARLDVRAVRAGRERLYFLLNGGLRVDSAWQELGDGKRMPLEHHQLWMVSIVELSRALKADEVVRVGLSYGGDLLAGGLGSAGFVEPDDVVLVPGDLWYPSDLQSFFQADVEVTVPSHLTLVHNGRELARVAQGDSKRVRWSTDRQVAGVALVAGRYASHRQGESEGRRYRVLLPAGIDLDRERLLDSLVTSDRELSAYYGPSGFPQMTLFVNRRLGGAFHDGTGLIGIAPSDFRGGDYGFAAIAREVAHNWWGGTVAENWLAPGAGGEWIVEGFAGFSSWWVVRKHFGEAALLRELRRGFYNPNTARTLQAMSVLDNALDPAARQTIYNKGSYVAFMLQQRLGEETFGAAARQFLAEFRHRAVTAADLEATFAKTSGLDLAEFFASWVHSDAVLDLALDPRDGDALARNRRTALPPAKLDLWRFPPAAEPERQSIAPGGRTPLGNAERLVLDPLGRTADMYRSNNVLPRDRDPRAVARSARGAIMVVEGEPFPWEPAAVKQLDTSGRTTHSWEFERGLLRDPAWSADGTRILAVEAPRGGRPNLFVLNATDGSRHRIGHEEVVTGTAGGIVVARGSRLVRMKGGVDSVLVRHAGARIAALLASPDSKAVAYVVVRGLQMDLRVIGIDGKGGRLLMSWAAGPVRWRWSPDGSRVFAVLPGDWDWQLWELPADGSSPRPLVREAATIGDLAVGPGGRIAAVAQSELDYGRERHEIFVIDSSAQGGVQHFNLSGRDAHGVSWLDDDTLLVIVSDPTYAVVPTHRELRRLRLSDGSLLEFP